MNLKPWLLYGATGYTGRKIAELAVRRGHRPVLAGRNREKLEQLAHPLDLTVVSFGLEEADRLRSTVADHDLVVNAAAPYDRTAPAFLSAAIDGRTHYLDVAGEFDLLTESYARDTSARDAGIVAVPACAFQVVPSDAIVADLLARAPKGRFLELGVETNSPPSRGTLKASLDVIAEGGRIRRGGSIEQVRLGLKGPNVRFHPGERATIVAPLADLAAACRACSVPEISTYLALKPGAGPVRLFARPLGWILRSQLLRQSIRSLVDRLMSEKDETDAISGSIWGRITEEDGTTHEAWTRTGPPYAYTAGAIVAAVEEISNGPSRFGVLTSSQAFGPRFSEKIEGIPVERRFPL